MHLNHSDGFALYLPFAAIDTELAHGFTTVGMLCGAVLAMPTILKLVSKVINQFTVMVCLATGRPLPEAVFLQAMADVADQERAAAVPAPAPVQSPVQSPVQMGPIPAGPPEPPPTGPRDLRS